MGSASTSKFASKRIVDGSTPPDVSSSSVVVCGSPEDASDPELASELVLSDVEVPLESEPSGAPLVVGPSAEPDPSSSPGSVPSPSTQPMLQITHMPATKREVVMSIG